jgi:hypothetical protein
MASLAAKIVQIIQAILALSNLAITVTVFCLTYIDRVNKDYIPVLRATAVFISVFTPYVAVMTKRAWTFDSKTDLYIVYGLAWGQIFLGMANLVSFFNDVGAVEPPHIVLTIDDCLKLLCEQRIVNNTHCS